MQSIIYFIFSVIFSVIISNFLQCAKYKNGEDFNIKYFINKFKIKKVDITFILIFFILFEILGKYMGSVQTYIFIPLIFALLLAFCMDIKYMIIPDTSNVIIFALGIINILNNFSWNNVKDNVLGMLVGGLSFYIIDKIFRMVTKKTGFGFGDIKLLASIGLLFGYKAVIVIIFLSIFISATFSIIFLLYNKIIKKNKCEYLPFGPFIVISTFIICIIPYGSIISAYFNMLDAIIEKMM